MTERRGGPSTPPPERESKRWDTEAIAGALGVSTESRVDQLYGQGVRFRLGQPPGTELELFPSSRTVRLTGEDMQLSLFRQDPPRLAEEGVVFELPGRSSRSWLSVSPDGAATLFYDPATSSEVTESAPQTPGPAADPNSRRAAGDGVSGDSAAPQMVADSPSPESPSGREQEARVRLAGRLGTDVRYRTTRNGKLVASFPLGIKQDNGSTCWQDVLVFGERAANLEAAKDLVRKQMRAGATLETLLNTHPSAWGERYSATVGGTIWRGAGATREYRALEVDQVGVRQIDGQECWGIFPLRELYAEVWEEEHPEEPAPGELMEQKQLL